MSYMPSTQYQHYIPQFMLRRFATRSQSHQKSTNHRRQRRNDNKLVKAVDLSRDVPDISNFAVKKIFGNQDMYKDDSRFTQDEQMHVERKLAGIEQNASRIIALVVDAHTSGKATVALSRSDKDLLRKFQFVMRYRGPAFFRRFDHQTPESYNSNDRGEFLRYMQENNFKRPLDVWFDNLIKIIDAPMDPAGDWIMKLVKTIYRPDALWLFINIRSMYMAFVTPNDADEEFILTDNAFGIHEGPVSYVVDRDTGKETMTAYTEYHLLTVISPRLAMILRHESMPEPTEDMDAKVRDEKRKQRLEDAQMHLDPDNATSILEDLPIARPRNSYSEMKDGRLQLAEGADGKLRDGDMFHFSYFSLKSRHVQTINTVMLDQAHKVSKLVFKSESALRKALEFYLSSPIQAKGLHSIKTISDRPDDPMLLLFRKLEHVAHLVGSDVKAKYHVDIEEPPPQFTPAQASKVTDISPGKKSSEFSRKGLRKAFDDIGRDI